jgi:hypothetical protein
VETPSNPGILDNAFKNARSGYAQYQGETKNKLASERVNEIADEIDTTEKIRFKTIQTCQQTFQKMDQIQRMIFQTMKEYKQGITESATAQRNNIKSKKKQYETTCAKIKANLNKYHRSNDCNNCNSFDNGVLAHQALLEDEELLDATIEVVETFRVLALKSLNAEKADGSKSTPFTDLQHEVAQNRNIEFLIDRPNRRLKKSTYGKEVLAMIPLDIFGYPQRQDIGTDTCVLMTRVMSQVNDAVEGFRYLSQDKHTVMGTEKALQKGKPFSSADTRFISDSVI